VGSKSAKFSGPSYPSSPWMTLDRPSSTSMPSMSVPRYHIKMLTLPPPSPHPLVLYAFTEDAEVKQTRTSSQLFTLRARSLTSRSSLHGGASPRRNAKRRASFQRRHSTHGRRPAALLRNRRVGMCVASSKYIPNDRGAVFLTLTINDVPQMATRR
jgi:hypothetical protein